WGPGCVEDHGDRRRVAGVSAAEQSEQAQACLLQAGRAHWPLEDAHRVQQVVTVDQVAHGPRPAAPRTGSHLTRCQTKEGGSSPRSQTLFGNVGLETLFRETEFRECGPQTEFGNQVFFRAGLVPGVGRWGKKKRRS